VIKKSNGTLNPNPRSLTPDRRYIRQTILPHWGEEGQAKLAAAKVLVIGAGGIGSPALLYLAAAGVGTLGIVDADRVELSNLHRQVLHETADIGRMKVDSATDALHDLNPEITIIPYAVRLGDSTPSLTLPLEGEGIIEKYDIILDGSDNFETRLWVSDACVKHQKTLISAALGRFEGQLATFKPHAGEGLPCYRCYQPELPPAGTIPPCSENGVLPPMAGVLGAWAAAEIIKEIVGLGASLAGRMLRVNMLDATTRTVHLPKDPACVCKCK
jgi:molybdopterin-synthase adenylyltransferase